MFSKKLSEIREDLREEIAKGDVDAEWFDEQLRKLEGKQQPNEREIKTLRLLRDALASSESAVPK